MKVDEKQVRFLVKMAKRGRRRGMEGIYEIFAEPIFRYILLRVGNREEAEDLTSRIFLKVFQKIKTYTESEVPFSAWIFRVAHNELIDYFRLKRPLSQSLDEVYNEPASFSLQPEVRLLDEELRERIIQALRKLTAEQREAVILRYLENFSFKEISEIMGKREEAVRSLLSRALRKLNFLLLEEKDEFSEKVIAFKKRG